MNRTTLHIVSNCYLYYIAALLQSFRRVVPKRRRGILVRAVRTFWLLCLLPFSWMLPFDARAASVSLQTSVPIGLNKFDLFQQYLGTASGGDGGVLYRRVTRAMALKALDDARDAGVGLMRVSVSGYAPASHGAHGDLDLWRSSPAAFWPQMDAMMDDLDAHGIRIVPVLMWNVAQFPAMAGDTVADLIRKPESASWQMLAAFATDFVSRYHGRKTILFYELGNELNLETDLDIVRRCNQAKRGKLCDVLGNFSTSEMIAFTRRFAEVLRKADNATPISLGFSVPRGAAEHLRARPEWLQGGPDWTPDTDEQFANYLKDVHSASDIISVHLYDETQNHRFGSSDSVALLVAAKRAADQAGKPLFVGEFGEREPAKADANSFTFRMIAKLTELGVPYSAVWVWEFYQFKTYLTHDNENTVFSLEPGYTGFLIDQIRATNIAAGRTVTPIVGADTVPPRLVLTWPLECALLTDKQRIHAVASDDRGKVSLVEFSIGDRRMLDAEPPYEWELNADELAAGEYELQARASDAAGNAATSSAHVFVGQAAESQRCMVDSARDH